MREFTNPRIENSKVKQVLVPKCLQILILKLSHETVYAGHLGIHKTQERILARFYWSSVLRDVSQFITSCKTCQLIGKSRYKNVAPLILTETISTPFKRWIIDIIGPLEKSKKNNRFILTMIDDATRYPECFALLSCDAVHVTDK